MQVVKVGPLICRVGAWWWAVCARDDFASGPWATQAAADEELDGHCQLCHGGK